MIGYDLDWGTYWGAKWPVNTDPMTVAVLIVARRTPHVKGRATLDRLDVGSIQGR